MNTEKLNWNVAGTLQKWTPEQVAEHGEDVDKLVDPDETVQLEGNLLLSEGIELMLNLLTGNTGFGAAYSNANARIGIGNDNTPAAAGQTGLIASSPAPVYKGMETGYPAISSTTVTFQAKYESGEANFAWNEWSIDNGSSTNLNRKVVSLGTKAGGVWTLTISITVS